MSRKNKNPNTRRIRAKEESSGYNTMQIQTILEFLLLPEQSHNYKRTTKPHKKEFVVAQFFRSRLTHQFLIFCKPKRDDAYTDHSSNELENNISKIFIANLPNQVLMICENS